MKKHKANELLHQASMLATTVSAQIESLGGDLPETITDFGSNKYGKFSTSVTQTEDKKKFVLTIENMDSAVCTQMEKMVGGMVQGASCSGTTLTLSYYKNLATTEAEGEKSPTGVKPECSPACQEGQQCIGGACATVTPEAVNGCSKNSDCDEWCATNGNGEKCYCFVDSNVLDDGYFHNFTGSCDKAKIISGITDGYIASDSDITWWAAVNFCKVHGTSLLSLSDLGVTITTGVSQFSPFCEGIDCIGTDLAKQKDKLAEDDYGYWLMDGVRCDQSGKCILDNNNPPDVLDIFISEPSIYNSPRNSFHKALCK